MISIHHSYFLVKLKKISILIPNCGIGWIGWLSQTRPISRSPDGDKKLVQRSKIWEGTRSLFCKELIETLLLGSTWDGCFCGADGGKVSLLLMLFCSMVFRWLYPLKNYHGLILFSQCFRYFHVWNLRNNSKTLYTLFEKCFVSGAMAALSGPRSSEQSPISRGLQ